MLVQSAKGDLLLGALADHEFDPRFADRGQALIEARQYIAICLVQQLDLDDFRRLAERRQKIEDVDLLRLQNSDLLMVKVHLWSALKVLGKIPCSYRSSSGTVTII